MDRMVKSLARRTGCTLTQSMRFEDWLTYCSRINPETLAQVNRIRKKFLGLD